MTAQSPRPSKPLLFAAQIMVERDGQELVGPARFELLRQIDQQGSITAAAQSLQVSYRTAWAAVDTLNNLAGEALVERAKGGAGGGGARLTQTGRRLMDTYAQLRERQQEFLDWLAQGGQDLDHYISMLGRLNLRTSARNQLTGTVERCDVTGPQVRLQLRLTNAQNLRALISTHSMAQLGLRKGCPVVAVFKASAVHAAAPEELIPANANRLEGNVAHIEEGAGRIEVTLALPGGLSVHCLQAIEADRPLPVSLGSSAFAVFAPTAVLVAAGE